MPLSKAAPRTQVHTREIVCRGYRRDDGLWDIEGSIIDTKPHAVSNRDRGGIAAGEAIHHMVVRLTIDETMTVHAAEASTESGPYAICGGITPAYTEALKGLRVAPGWRKAVLSRLGGAAGCTHISDLLVGPMAVTAFQSMREARFKRYAERKADERPAQLDTCHTFASDSPVTRERWPEFYTGSDAPADTTPKRFD